MIKTIFNARHARVEFKDGRKVLAHVATTLPEAALEGLLAGLGEHEVAAVDAAVAEVEAALAELAKRKGSVVPEDYRVRYGAEQSCGDAVARALTDKVTDPKTGVDLEACREVAEVNGKGDKFDTWVAKGLNPGMVRMNLGNVLRGMARRGEPVLGLELAEVDEDEDEGEDA